VRRNAPPLPTNDGQLTTDKKAQIDTTWQFVYIPEVRTRAMPATQFVYFIISSVSWKGNKNVSLPSPSTENYF